MSEERIAEIEAEIDRTLAGSGEPAAPNERKDGNALYIGGGVLLIIVIVLLLLLIF